MGNPSEAKYLTPPEVARLLRVDGMKVLEWIRRGEIVAVNVAARGATRPRWRVAQSALEAFLQARTAIATLPVQRRPRRRCAHVIEFFK